MALAEVTHHTSPRGQKTARARGEERDELYDAKGLMTPPPSRPTPLVEVRPQGRVQRHFLEHMADICPCVQILDAPVPQTVGQLPDVLRVFDTLIPVAEQVIDVPKIFIERIPPRTSVREAEQLVEVPTIVSYSSLQRSMEQHVDIPVPRRGGGISGLRGVFPGQSSTAQLASQDRTSERIAEQIVGFPVSRGGPPDFCLGQVSSSFSHVPARDQEGLDEVGEGVFRTFPREKKVQRSPAR